MKPALNPTRPTLLAGPGIGEDARHARTSYGASAGRPGAPAHDYPARRSSPPPAPSFADFGRPSL